MARGSGDRRRAMASDDGVRGGGEGGSLLSEKGLQCSRFGGAKLQEPCVIWYLGPFACLYDLLQFGFGQRNGLERRSDEAGRERVVLA
jgi:hypothetical protein